MNAYGEMFCRPCGCWWSGRKRGRVRRFCPVCNGPLVVKPIDPSDTLEEIRPGVFAMWTDPRERRAGAREGGGA